MDFIELVNNTKDRDCESKKKISFSQRSPVETKKSNSDNKFGFLGYSFSIKKGEIIESALFDRIKRDCGGELINVVAVRRFRKVGSDEWFSVEASIGNDSWDVDFEDSNDDEAINQGVINSESRSSVNNGVTFELPKSFKKINPIEESNNKKGRNIVIISVVLLVAFYGYKLYKNKNNG